MRPPVTSRSDRSPRPTCSSRHRHRRISPFSPTPLSHSHVTFFPFCCCCFFFFFFFFFFTFMVNNVLNTWAHRSTRLLVYILSFYTALFCLNDCVRLPPRSFIKVEWLFATSNLDVVISGITPTSFKQFR